MKGEGKQRIAEETEGNPRLPRPCETDLRLTITKIYTRSTGWNNRPSNWYTVRHCFEPIITAISRKYCTAHNIRAIFVISISVESRLMVSTIYFILTAHIVCFPCYFCSLTSQIFASQCTYFFVFVVNSFMVFFSVMFSPVLTIRFITTSLTFANLSIILSFSFSLSIIWNFFHLKWQTVILDSIWIGNWSFCRLRRMSNSSFSVKLSV